LLDLDILEEISSCSAVRIARGMYEIKGRNALSKFNSPKVLIERIVGICIVAGGFIERTSAANGRNMHSNFNPATTVVWLM
jgi:hypothetical protein